MPGALRLHSDILPLDNFDFSVLGTGNQSGRQGRNIRLNEAELLIFRALVLAGSSAAASNFPLTIEPYTFNRSKYLLVVWPSTTTPPAENELSTIHAFLHGASLDDANGHFCATRDCMSSWRQRLVPFRPGLLLGSLVGPYRGTGPLSFQRLTSSWGSWFSSIGDQPLPTMIPPRDKIMSTRPVKHHQAIRPPGKHGKA